MSIDPQLLFGDNRNSPLGTPIQFGAPITRIHNGEKQYMGPAGSGLVYLNTPNPYGMRTHSRLPAELWKAMDAVVTRSKAVPRAGMNAAMGANLVRPVAPTKLVKSYTKQSRVGEPTVSLQGRTNPARDSVDLKEGGTVLPVIMSEYSRGWREPDDFDEDNFAAHVDAVLNKQEESFHVGYPGIKKGEYQSYGILNTPDSVSIAATGDFGTISNIMPSVRALIAQHATLGNYNGIHLFMHTDQYLEVSAEYYDGVETSPLKRILDLPQIEAVHQVPNEHATAGTLASVRMAGDAFNWVQGMEVQVREWTSPNGLVTYYVVIAIGAPLIKTTHEDDHNVVLMTGA